MERSAKLAKILKKEGLDAFLVSNPSNIYYISGFKAEDSVLLITKKANFVITDFRYKQEAEKIVNFQLRLVEGSFKDTFIKILKEQGAKKVGFEAEYLSYQRATLLKNHLKSKRMTLEPLTDEIDRLRMIKDEQEIREIRNSIDISKKALNALKNIIRPGITEKKLALELDNLIKEFGGEESAFTTIVASGENASRPHAAVSNKVLRSGEPVVIDFGATCNSYKSDLTRVFFLGKIQGQLLAIYNICKEAQRRAIGAIRPGIKAGEVDKTARDFISSNGYGKFFGHSLGHGVGLCVHEQPRISVKSNQTLKENMVFTVEPGIYIPGLGGVRVEDMVLVTDKGCEVLSNDIPK